jgi:hypothetical protein
MNADKMKTPLLLVHGEADNNPGTFTLQTERYFQALKGLEHQQEWLFYRAAKKTSCTSFMGTRSVLENI